MRSNHPAVASPPVPTRAFTAGCAVRLTSSNQSRLGVRSVRTAPSMTTLADWFGPALYNTVGSYLEEELGAENIDDLLGLQPEHLEAIKSKLKPLQVPKFQAKYDSLVSGGGQGDAEQPQQNKQGDEVVLAEPTPQTDDLVPQTSAKKTAQSAYDVESANLQALRASKANAATAKAVASHGYGGQDPVQAPPTAASKPANVAPQPSKGPVAKIVAAVVAVVIIIVVVVVASSGSGGDGYGYGTPDSSGAF